jgi:hypothetical protein
VCLFNFKFFISLSITLLGRYQPPWDENWELDDRFFTQMEAWERDHPESTFAKVIEKVDNVIKTGKPFLEVIPDSPFPARTIVHCLAHLLQLGTVCIIHILFVFQTLTTVYRKSHLQKKKYTNSRCKCRLGSILLGRLFEHRRTRNLLLRLERIWMPYGGYLGRAV